MFMQSDLELDILYDECLLWVNPTKNFLRKTDIFFCFFAIKLDHFNVYIFFCFFANTQAL